MLSIQSRGEIDVNALRLMGASVKGDDAIGEFGSGLKYAIACLLRHQVAFSVYSGTTLIPITTVREEFRGEPFDVIMIGGERTSLTTRTGPKWKQREAIRELWSNALDEGDAIKSREALQPKPGFTTINVQETPEIADMLDNWGQYFLHGTPCLYTCDRGSIHRQATTNYFRKGVWICQEAKPLPLFSYNFTAYNSPNLPESRLVSAAACGTHVARLYARCDNEEILTALLDTVADTHPGNEWNILNAYYYQLQDQFTNTLMRIFLRSYTHIGALRNKAALSSRILPEHKVLWCEDNAYAALCDLKFPRIEESLDHNPAYTVKPWPIGIKDIVDERLAFLAKHSIVFPPSVTFHFAEFRHGPLLAAADVKNKRCLLSEQVANVGQSKLTQALIEEWTHLAHNVADFTVEQQHVYLNLITGLLGCGSSNSPSPSPSSPSHFF
jgi:hypothetical protein